MVHFVLIRVAVTLDCDGNKTSRAFPVRVAELMNLVVVRRKPGDVALFENRCPNLVRSRLYGERVEVFGVDETMKDLDDQN